MGFTHGVAKTIGKAIRGVHAGERKLAAHKLDVEGLPRLEVGSPEFEPDGPLPVDATVDGAGLPPPLAWRGVPSSARSLAILCEDPDAPMPEPFVHWILYGLPASVPAVDGKPEGVGDEGKNSRQQIGFTPAAPPAGHGVHHYHFEVFALDEELAFPEGTGRGALLEAMQGHVVAWGELVGTYERN